MLPIARISQYETSKPLCNRLKYALAQRPLFGMCGNWIGPGSTIECLLSAGAGPAVSDGPPGRAGHHGRRPISVAPVAVRWSPPGPVVSGIRGARLALAEADSWMILCLQIQSGRQPLHPRPCTRVRALRGVLGLATALGGVQAAARPARARMSSGDGLSGSIPASNAQNDGQMILKAASEGWKLRPHLGKLVELRVELRGFEPPDLSHAMLALCQLPGSALGSRCQGWWR
jgi:hypothetical protein